MWKIINALLGAGMGFFGTILRTALAGVGGWLAIHGVDVGIATQFGDALIGLIMLGLAVLGSYANNKVQAGE